MAIAALVRRGYGATIGKLVLRGFTSADIANGVPLTGMELLEPHKSIETWEAHKAIVSWEAHKSIEVIG